MNNRINEPFSPRRLRITALTELAYHSSCFCPSCLSGQKVEWLAAIMHMVADQAPDDCRAKRWNGWLVSHMVADQPPSVSAHVAVPYVLMCMSCLCLFLNEGNLLSIQIPIFTRLLKVHYLQELRSIPPSFFEISC